MHDFYIDNIDSIHTHTRFEVHNSFLYNRSSDALLCPCDGSKSNYMPGKKISTTVYEVLDHLIKSWSFFMLIPM